MALNRDAWLQQYELQPHAVQEYLLNPNSTTHEEAAQQELAYDIDAWDRVMDVVWELLFLKQSYTVFHEALKPLIGDRTIGEVERSLLFHVVLPMGDLLTWEVEDRLLELGVPLKEIQSVPRISLRPVSYGAAVRRIASIAKLSLLSEEYVRRLREVLVSYLKGARSADQAKEVMQRSQTDGGIGFSRDQADLFMKTTLDFMTTTHVMSEQDYADWLAHEQSIAEERQAEQVQAAKAAILKARDEDAVSVASNVVSASAQVARSAMDQAVLSVMQEIGDLSLDEYRLKRLQSTISTRLTDVRNDIQTKSILQREVKVGGIELDHDAADRVAVLIERAYNTFRSAIVEEEKKKIEQIMEGQKQKVEERKKRESEEHAKWYQEKMKSSQVETDLQQQFAQAMQNMAASPSPLPSGSHQVDGVIAPAPRRLKGLAEELGGMRWEDFRRLASTPEAAAEKVQQKLETLKAESFERWTEGVQAWRNSPIQRDYLSLVTESFGPGKPVAELVEAKHALDPRTPSSAEVSALIQLNGAIQF